MNQSWISIDPPSRLKIVVMEPKGTRTMIAAQFNPKEVSVDSSVPWTEKKGHLEYTNQALQTMSFELLFDGFETGESVIPDIVALQELTKPMRIAGQPVRPPKLRIIWGADRETYNLPCFTAVIESVSVKYQMFSPDGQVLRATANVKFKEAGLVTVGRPS